MYKIKYFIYDPVSVIKNATFSSKNKIFIFFFAERGRNFLSPKPGRE